MKQLKLHTQVKNNKPNKNPNNHKKSRQIIHLSACFLWGVFICPLYGGYIFDNIDMKN